MTTYQVDAEPSVQFNHIFYNEQINKVINVIIPQFEATIRRSVIFNMFFLALGISEIFLFLFFFTVIAESSLIAITLGCMFLTLFSYFILKLYFQTRKAEQLEKIKNRFTRGCQELMQYQSDVPEHHIALANACSKLANRLERKEFYHYTPPHWLGFLRPLMQRFSWRCHWLDYHRMKELLLTVAVNEHVELVKLEPTRLDVHASLANAYVILSGVYTDPRKVEGIEENRWISDDIIKEMQAKFRSTAKRAIEEFKILNNFAPDDPWVHAQLAYSYHDLQMPEEEIRAYEEIHRLAPQDQDNLYKLGVLYFQQGLNSQGLEVYEKLNRYDYQKAESLIRYYGAGNQSKVI